MTFQRKGLFNKQTECKKRACKRRKITVKDIEHKNKNNNLNNIGALQYKEQS